MHVQCALIATGTASTATVTIAPQYRAFECIPAWPVIVCVSGPKVFSPKRVHKISSYSQPAAFCFQEAGRQVHFAMPDRLACLPAHFEVTAHFLTQVQVAECFAITGKDFLLLWVESFDGRIAFGDGVIVIIYRYQAASAVFEV